MNKILNPIICLLAYCSVFQEPIQACSVFCIDKGNNLIVGRNYDWSYGEGLLIVNKRNHLKTAFIYQGESKSDLATWTSKYGSITFNQYGRDVPFSGMNEAGLVVSRLWLNQTQYPSVDSRPSISVDQYMQYLLDNFGSVDEIIASDLLVRIRPLPGNFTKIHFFAVDSTGNGVTIEFINGKMVYHTGNTMPIKAITNNTYEESVAYFNSVDAPGTTGNSSLNRFYRAASLARDYDLNLSGSIINYSFDILQQVAQGNRTKFSVVFDIKNRKIYFKSLIYPNIRYLAFDSFDYSCQTSSKVLDINVKLSGDVGTQFINYTTRINEDLIKKAWTALGSTDIDQPSLSIMSEYPESFQCTQTYSNNFKKPCFNICLNPTTCIYNKVLFTTPSQQGITEIYNIVGKLLPTNTSRNKANATSDLTGFPAGMHFIKVIANGEIYSESFVNHNEFLKGTN